SPGAPGPDVMALHNTLDVAVRPASSTVLLASSTANSALSGPTGIQVGPTGTTTPTVPVEGSGGTVAGGTQASPGLFDITGHIEAAIDSWFSDLVTSALEPALT